jgi:transposase
MDETQYSLNTYSQIKRQGHPECSCGLGVSKTDHYTLKCKANAWRTMFYNAKKREDSIKQNATEQNLALKAQISSLQEELDSVKAQLSQYQRMLFGKKSEKSKTTGAVAHIMKRGKKRGPQKGQPGHGRTTLDLPIKEEIVELPSPLTSCRRCRLPYLPMNATDDSEVIEISVSAYKRVIKRMKYKRHPECSCYCAQKFRTAPMPPKCMPKGKFGSSIYANLLVGKFGYHIPLYRLIKQFSQYDINISPGTVTGGFKTLLPLLEPVYNAIKKYSQADDHWHVDETG